MLKKSVFVLFLLMLGIVLLVGCVAGPNVAEKTSDPEDKIYGFWSGLWHGMISPITFLISLFSDNVHIYEVHNNGNWYDFGFVLGAGILFGGGSRAASSNKS